MPIFDDESLSLLNGLSAGKQTQPGVVESNSGTGASAAPAPKIAPAAAVPQMQAAAPQQQDAAPQQQAPAGKIFGADDMSMLGSVQGAEEVNKSFYDAVPGATPNNPIDVSPVSAMDRMKMSFGNARGSIDYLKTKYQDVAFAPNKGLVVKNAGKWQQVDPDHWGGGDAWDKTKEIAKDMADMGGAAVVQAGSLVGTLAGTRVGGKIGSVLGAGAGGAGGEAVRSSLGRLVGTYNATPEEETKDIVVEGLLNMGGQTIALGARPVMSTIAKGISNFAESAAPAVKQSMAKVLAATSDTAPENMARVFDRPNEVMGHVTSAVKSATAEEGADVVLKKGNMAKVKDLLSSPYKALSSAFAEKEDDLLAAVPKSLKLNVGDTVNGAMAELSSIGILKPKVGGETGKIVGYSIDRDAVSELLKHPEGNQALTHDAIKTLGQFVNLGNESMQVGVKTGSEAVESLLSIRRGFDKFYFGATASNPDLKAVLTPASSMVRNNIVTAIHEVSPEVASKYATMNQMYTEMLPAAAKAARVVHNYNGPETFVNQLMTRGDENVANKQLVNLMAGLKGKAGEELGNSLKDGIAATDFLRVAPKVSWSKVGAGATAFAAHGTVLGPAAAAGALAAAPATSPRVVGRTVQAAAQALPYTQKFGDFVKSLAPQQMRQLITSPEAFDALIRTTTTGVVNEQQSKQQLLQQAGVPSQ